jgi:hypothetical protein
VDESSVMLKLGPAPGARQPSRARRNAVSAPSGRSPVQDRVEREMLKLIARDADTYRTYANQLEEEHFQSEANRALLAALLACGGDLRAASASDQDEAMSNKLTQLALEPVEGEPGLAYAAGVFARLKELSLQLRSDDLRRELQKLNPTTDPGYEEMFGRLIAMDGELRRLREAAAAAEAGP